MGILNRAEAKTKLGYTGVITDPYECITKREVISYGGDPSKLTKYPTDYELVEDSDIVKKEEPVVVTKTKFVLFAESRAQNLLSGYFVGNELTLDLFKSGQNYHRVTAFMDVTSQVPINRSISFTVTGDYDFDFCQYVRFYYTMNFQLQGGDMSGTQARMHLSNGYPDGDPRFMSLQTICAGQHSVYSAIDDFTMLSVDSSHALPLTSRVTTDGNGNGLRTYIFQRPSLCFVIDRITNS